MKRVCDGWILTAQQWGMYNCTFCRMRFPCDQASALAMIQKRGKSDAAAMHVLGDEYYGGTVGLAKSVPRAIELKTKTLGLGLGSICAGPTYFTGHLSLAAGRNESTRDKQAQTWLSEYKRGNYNLAVQHMISAKMGYEKSLDEIKDMFIKGHATKAQTVCQGFEEVSDSRGRNDKPPTGGSQVITLIPRKGESRKVH